MKNSMQICKFINILFILLLFCFFFFFSTTSILNTNNDINSPFLMKDTLFNEIHTYAYHYQSTYIKHHPLQMYIPNESLNIEQWIHST